jgi:hydrogenase nickel incorporation protein HypA/HybF
LRVHELAICQSVLRQVMAIPACRTASRISRITLRIGPLAGVEPDLLRRAFPLISAGTPCDGAVLAIEQTAVRVCCRLCATTSDVRPNRLICGRCGTWQVAVVQGDEMLLADVELFDRPTSVPASTKDPAHV